MLIARAIMVSHNPVPCTVLQTHTRLLVAYLLLRYIPFCYVLVARSGSVSPFLCVRYRNVFSTAHLDIQHRFDV